MIDTDGYRLNVGIILVNQERQVLWAKRIGQPAWQFPQGGIKAHEAPERAVLRELYEELGVRSKQVHILGHTKQWLKYDLPAHLIRYHQKPLCIGQKQKWFMLRFTGKNEQIHLDQSEIPEFDQWEWVDYWYPLTQVIDFKYQVYEMALKELNPLLNKQSQSPVKSPAKKIYYRLQ